MTAAEQFIAKYEGREVPYAAEVIAALRGGSAHVSHSPEAIHSTSTLELLHTYKVRAKHLARFPTPHAVQLRRDVEAFCVNLSEKTNLRCVAWGIESSPHFMYWFWEWSSDGRFLGATKTIDARKISKPEKILLWGRK